MRLWPFRRARPEPPNPLLVPPTPREREAYGAISEGMAAARDGKRAAAVARKELDRERALLDLWGPGRPIKGPNGG